MWMSDEVEAVDVDDLRTPLSSFFNATLNQYDVDQKGVTIGWSAFPGGVRTPHSFANDSRECVRAG